MNSVDELNLLLGIGPARPQLPVTLRKSGYLPVRALGKGSYGQALLVFHEPRQQYFVVKHLNLAGMSSRQRHDAHNEINILQKLHHPNIVQYVEYYEEHPHLYIVMEYADGGDVFSLLSSAQAARKASARAYRGLGNVPASAAASNAASGLLSEAQVVSLFVQTTMAVRYMHDRRLLHRDIKSSNIFLTKNHIVKLGDFGISTVLQSTMAMASTMCGTPCYFSPELCQGRPYNNKSDMWALGVLLYELCAGHVPFESTTMKTLMRDIVHRQPPRIPALYSDALWELIVQLLQKDPRRRPDAGQVLMSGALMKYVPELIEQLAADPAYAAAAKVNVSEDNSNVANVFVKGSGGTSSSAQKSAEAVPPPPPPPPRKFAELHAARPSGQAHAAAPSSPSPNPGVQVGPERPAVPPPQPASPGSRPTCGGASAGGTSDAPSSPPPHPPNQQNKQQQQQQPTSSTASIAVLLARFDAQKQQLAENKLRKHEQQQQQPASRPEGSGEGAAVVHLSPGAVAALRQQGLDPEKDSQIFPVVGNRGGGGDGGQATRAAAAGAERAKGALGPRRSFAPPPLPAALREPTARPAAAVQNADSAASDHHRHNYAAPSTDKEDTHSQRQAVAPVQIGSEELGAVLTELSTWRDRSLRRQRRHEQQLPPSSSLNGPSEKLNGGARSPEKGVEDASVRPSPPPLPVQRRASEPQDKKGQGSAETANSGEHATVAGASAVKAVQQKVAIPSETGSRGAEVAAPPPPNPPLLSTSSALSPCPANRSSQETGIPPHLSALAFAEASSPHPHPTPLQQQQQQQQPQKQSTPQRSSLDAKSRTPLADASRFSFSPPSPLARSARDASALPPNAHDEDDKAESFVDAMGTTLDVRALQASSSVAPPPPPSALSASAVRHSHQQSMRKSFCGTSERIDALRSTLPAGSVLTQPNAVEKPKHAQVGLGLPTTTDTPHPEKDRVANESADQGDDEAADLRFTTACLCGRATTTGGCLSMIYGSFICTCDVCVRFTGAAQGVEWLHLPEVLDGIGALIQPSPSSAPSPLRKLSAGGGAVAAAAFRAQAAQSPSSTHAGPATSVRDNQAAAPSSPAQLRSARIRSYTHTHHLRHGTASPVDGEAEGDNSGETETYVIYSCDTCGGLVGMVHDDVPGLLLPKPTLDEQSLHILSSCAQTVVLDEED